MNEEQRPTTDRARDGNSDVETDAGTRDTETDAGSSPTGTSPPDGPGEPSRSTVEPTSGTAEPTTATGEQPTTSRPTGKLGDDHALTVRARAYAHSVVTGHDWPIDEEDVDLDRLTWKTSTRARRRHGLASYDGDGRVTITLSEHTYERAGFEASAETIRHELVHAWQYQHRGELAIVTEDGVVASTYHEKQDEQSMAIGEQDEQSATLQEQDERVIRVATGHGDSFRAWLAPLDIEGRRVKHYRKTRADYAYTYECPECETWRGAHRLCKRVRQAAHGTTGSTGYRYCTACESLLQLRRGPVFLEHGDHDDDAIRAFARGEDADLPTVAASDVEPVRRPVR